MLQTHQGGCQGLPPPVAAGFAAFSASRGAQELLSQTYRAYLRAKDAGQSLILCCSGGRFVSKCQQLGLEPGSRCGHRSPEAAGGGSPGVCHVCAPCRSCVMAQLEALETIFSLCLGPKCLP